MSDAEKAAEVCLLDDDVSVLKSMRFLLLAEGFNVRAFSNPEEFLAHANKNHVAVLVTDVWMDKVTDWKSWRACARSRRKQR